LLLSSFYKKLLLAVLNTQASRFAILFKKAVVEAEE
jgi:hypothetical protein